QLITQVCGRAGRGETRGKAVIQTYSPNHWVIDCAKNQDFKAFYSKEIKLRKKLSYPPFCDVVHLVVSGENVNLVRDEINNITKEIMKEFEAKGIASTLLGPTPAPVSKIENRYRWRLIIKCESDEKLRAILREKAKITSKSDCTVSLDINSNNML
ncbi:MAG: primosomal protein N', partial [Clostridia bacterium]|nr:primosomal protein N' [Clostridia bacterium]